MNWADTPEQTAFRAEIQRFVQDRFPTGYTPEPGWSESVEPEDARGYNWPVDRSSGDTERARCARAWAEALAERGWVAPSWPVAYGGGGLSHLDEFVLQEELMRAGVPTVNGLGVFLLGPTLLRHGSVEQRAEHLPPIARGERVWAQAFSEPGAGSDLAGLTTRAEPAGDYYRLTGQKVWTSLGQYADWLFVLARTGPRDENRRHRGLTFLLVDTQTPGVTVRPITDIRGSEPFVEIFFDDVRVPVTQRVGEEGRGWYVAMDTLGFERGGIGACIKLERLLSRLVGHIASGGGDEQLRPGWAQSTRAELACRYTETRALRNIALLTVSRLSSGVSPDHEASINQLFSSELQQRLARTGTDAFGQYGLLTRDEPGVRAPLSGEFARLGAESVAATFLGGTSEIQRSVIATRGLGLPRS